jgi:deoxyribodipyrimidine photo-lyase
MTKEKISIFWFRRDMRLEDNAALWQALKSGNKILPIFIFDKNILEHLADKKDARVLFIHQEISRLKKELEKHGSSLRVFYETPLTAYKKIIAEYDVVEVFANRDYEPYARARDKEIYEFLKSHKIDFKSRKDHVIFEKNEILKDDGKPYVVFTPYSKKWKSSANEFFLKKYPSENYLKNLYHCCAFELPKISEIGFVDFDFAYFPKREPDIKIIENYAANRDFPGINGTSHLSLHLRFGTISIRRVCQIASVISEKWLDELIWRDFYQMIMYHFPYCANSSFKPQYDKIKWRNDKEEFRKWCAGKTGYPIVDAGMRELNETGFMHNRVRMIVASFLCKHLLIDWSWGEKYFAQKLLDYELASNVGGWQWTCGSGCDSAPYFRIFNPDSQTEKFDPEFKYIKKWVPEFNDKSYEKPMVDHKLARVRCLETYKMALAS